MKTVFFALFAVLISACSTPDFVRENREMPRTWANSNYPEPKKWDEKKGEFVPDPGFWDRKPAPDATARVIENGKVVREIEIYSDSY